MRERGVYRDGGNGGGGGGGGEGERERWVELVCCMYVHGCWADSSAAVVRRECSVPHLGMVGLHAVFVETGQCGGGGWG